MKERVLLLPLTGDEKLCDGLSEVHEVAIVQAMICRTYVDTFVFVDSCVWLRMTPTMLMLSLSDEHLLSSLP